MFLLLFNSFIVINLIYILLAGGYDNCVLGPFQPIPYTTNIPVTTFTYQEQPPNQQQLTETSTNCSLRKALVKFPDKTTEIELQWLDESYVDLTVLNKTLHFKVRCLLDV